MDLDSLRLFVDLAETQSFSKTATRSFMSQSAVSQRIRALEREWGHTLVERGKGRPGAQFTEAGEILFIGAREILARSDALKRELAALAGAVSGSLRVATVYSIGLHALTPALSAFLLEYPQVNLHLEYLRTDRIYDALQSSSIDCGIVAVPRERPQIEVVPLLDENMVFIAAPRHPLAQEGNGVPLRPKQLRDLPFIGFDPDIPTRRLTDNFLAAHHVSVSVVQAFDNIETIKRMVEVGLGVAIVPEPTVVREVRDKMLVSRPFTDALSRPTGVLLRRSRTRSRALSRFLEVLARPDGAISDGPVIENAP